MSMFDYNLMQDIVAGAVGNLISGALLALFGFLLIDQAKLRPWIVKWLKPAVLNMWQSVVGFLLDVRFRVFVFVASIVLVYFGVNKEVYSLLTVVIFFSFVLPRKYEPLSRPSGDFSDGFNKLADVRRNWKVKTGDPTLDPQKGKPPPTLLLGYVPKESTCTFLLLKEIESSRGVIECDAFFDRKSVLNIVFLAHEDEDNWHMARFDTRPGTTDGFLVKDGGAGNNWRFNSMSTTRTGSGSWYRLRIEYSSERARMFRNGELVMEITNPLVFGKKVGMFNERGDVRIDNFVFSAS